MPAIRRLRRCDEKPNRDGTQQRRRSVPRTINCDSHAEECEVWKSERLMVRIARHEATHGNIGPVNNLRRVVWLIVRDDMLTLTMAVMATT
jgi:hypothetical protein